MNAKLDITKLKILAIDDEHFMLDVIVRALRGFDVPEVIKAGDVGEAIGLIARDSLKFDCIIADFNMKPMNGLQFLQRIRSAKETRIPANQNFIMLTGNARSEVVTACVALDVNAYLVKPVAAAKLKVAVERAMSLEWKLKSPKYYEAVNIEITDAFNDAEDKIRASAVVLPPRSIIRPAAETSFIDRKKLEAAGPPKPAPPEKPPKEPIMSVRRCSLEKLKEKMVLGEDISADDGIILIAKGTTLSQKMVNRLREVAADRKFVLIQKKL